MAIRVRRGSRSGVGRRGWVSPRVGRRGWVAGWVGGWVARRDGRAGRWRPTLEQTDRQTHRHTENPKSATPIPNAPRDSNTPLAHTPSL